MKKHTVKEIGAAVKSIELILEEFSDKEITNLLALVVSRHARNLMDQCECEDMNDEKAEADDRRATGLFNAALIIEDVHDTWGKA